MKRFLKITFKVILIFIGVNFLIMLIISSPRYRILKNKKDLTLYEKHLLQKYPYKSLYYLELSDTIYYYEYKSGVLVIDGGFYRINPHNYNFKR